MGSEFPSTIYRKRPFPRFISPCCPPRPSLQPHCSLDAPSPPPRTAPASFLSLLPITFTIWLRSHPICTLWILLAKHLPVLLAPERQKLILTITSPNSSCPSLISGIKEEKVRTPGKMRHLSMMPHWLLSLSSLASLSGFLVASHPVNHLDSYLPHLFYSITH